MAGNSFKSETNNNSGGGGGSLFRMLDNYLKLDKYFENGLPLKYLPKILFVTGVAIFYIGNNHYTERTIRSIDHLKSEVEDLRADYTTLKADYMYMSKQSEVARKILPNGLVESSVPPFKIIIEEDEY